MSRFRFALERVLRVRDVEHEIALVAWQAAEHTARTARTLVAIVRSQIDSTEGELLEHRSRPDGLPAEALRYHARLDELARKLGAARKRCDVAEAAAGRERARWEHARSELRGISKLEERRRASHALAEQRREGRTLEELASTRATRALAVAAARGRDARRAEIQTPAESSERLSTRSRTP